MSLSVVTAAVTVLFALANGFRLVVDFQSAMRHEAKLRKGDGLKRLLSGPELAKLGAYLEGELGHVDVERYAHDNRVRREVDSVLSRLADLLGAEGEVQGTSSDETADFSTAPKSTGLVRILSADITERLESGDEWGALLRLRSHIERKIEEVLKARGIPTARGGAGRLLSLLAREGVASSEVLEQARWAVNIANRAVHGQDVDAGDVRLALERGGLLIQALGGGEPLSPEAAKANESQT